MRITMSPFAMLTLLLVGLLSSGASAENATSAAASQPASAAPSKKSPAVLGSNLTNVTTATAANKTASSSNATAPAGNTTKPNPSDVVLPVGIQDNVNIKAVKKDGWFYDTWVKWADDSYVLSILFPIMCGLLAAVVILTCIACCSCCRRRCRNRRRRMLHKKMQDAKTVRRMKPSDRIKLLDEPSDEEF